VVGSCEHDNEPLGSLRDVKFFELGVGSCVYVIHQFYENSCW
jgi:hypothetical protein